MLNSIDEYLAKKIELNREYVVFTFFELRVKENLSQKEILSFLHTISEKLLKLGYSVFRTNHNYYYNGESRKVKENELLVAIKNKNS